MKRCFKYHSQLYSQTALIKAAYNFSDRAYIHLDFEDPYFLVEIEEKTSEEPIAFEEFENEMLAQNVRHEIYLQTKELREILTARAMATSVVMQSEDSVYAKDQSEDQIDASLLSETGPIVESSAHSAADGCPPQTGAAEFSEQEILKDWFGS